MRKVSLLFIVALIQICNLDVKGNGFEIQKIYKFEIANFEQITVHVFTLEAKSPLIRVLNPDSPDFGITNPEDRNLLAKESKYDTVQIQTSAVCKMCKERLEHDMAFEKGVTAVELDMETKVLTIVYKKGKTTEEDLKKAITKIGYDADDLVADQKAHDRLPDCCQKDVEPH